MTSLVQKSNFSLMVKGSPASLTNFPVLEMKHLDHGGKMFTDPEQVAKGRAWPTFFFLGQVTTRKSRQCRLGSQTSQNIFAEKTTWMFPGRQHRICSFNFCFIFIFFKSKLHTKKIIHKTRFIDLPFLAVTPAGYMLNCSLFSPLSYV